MKSTTLPVDREDEVIVPVRRRVDPFAGFGVLLSLSKDGHGAFPSFAPVKALAMSSLA